MSHDDVLHDPEDLDTLVDRVMSVADAGMRRAQIERHLNLVEADTAACHMEELLRNAVRGDDRSTEVILSLAETIESPANAAVELRIEGVNLHARAHGLHGVGWFLLDPPPARQPGDRVTATREQMREPLGVRRTQASGWHPHLLEKLLNDDHPMVVERLCANPRIQRHHIMTIITRRPTRAGVLSTVASVPRWFRDMEIRFAIASNPYGPTGLSLRILPTLASQYLTRVSNANDLHPMLRQAARWWLDARFGEPTSGGPGDHEDED